MLPYEYMLILYSYIGTQGEILIYNLQLHDEFFIYDCLKVQILPYKENLLIMKGKNSSCSRRSSW
jgi:hypothetical protein